ncbi:MAG: tRNA (adenosine(37)-N6)-dimethylallyltransferase MiaA [Roseibacillus sp.]|nr:tRNA (adenosine(37)-N6)-dimethylallyltransferase MiaA [Roseibacillus sp.]MCP4731391.1 tRNA (adenosine(37)-N6)-dimethylallyltransferase MiaA [Roseibacillus sp.]HJM63830.1 tRNA (adenosine(37)-N6)-dimethylallyltransferase MiaA [Roseibacillus sp.]
MLILNTPFHPLYLCGPTASGKSSHALALARSLNGEIVNADALQLYRGLEIITAAPCEEERRMAPHHLYGVTDPADSLDAALYRKLALPVLDDISSRGKLPIIVGGSGLYLKFLTHKPADLPSADPDLRTELEALPLAELNRRLEQVDPIEAARIDQNNPRYVQRALEVSLMTGRPVSEQRTSFEAPPESLRGLLLSWDSGTLEKRISRRTSHMLDHGAIEELAALSALGPAVSRAIGIPQLQRLLDGQIDRKTCEEEIVIATRRYAKRQRTWFRREKWLTPVPGDLSEEQMITTARALLRTGP